jgi:hypothetical protein
MDEEGDDMADFGSGKKGVTNRDLGGQVNLGTWKFLTRTLTPPPPPGTTSKTLHMFLFTFINTPHLPAWHSVKIHILSTCTGVGVL